MNERLSLLRKNKYFDRLELKTTNKSRQQPILKEQSVEEKKFVGSRVLVAANFSEIDWSW